MDKGPHGTIEKYAARKNIDSMIKGLTRWNPVLSSQLKKQKLEAAGSSGAVQALRRENDAPVVGPDAPTANSKMVKLHIATADWSRPTSGLRRPSRIGRYKIGRAHV